MDRGRSPSQINRDAAEKGCERALKTSRQGYAANARAHRQFAGGFQNAESIVQESETLAESAHNRVLRILNNVERHCQLAYVRARDTRDNRYADEASQFAERIRGYVDSTGRTLESIRTILTNIRRVGENPTYNFQPEIDVAVNSAEEAERTAQDAQSSYDSMPSDSAAEAERAAQDAESNYDSMQSD